MNQTYRNCIELTLVKTNGHDWYYGAFFAVCGAPKRRFRPYEPAVTKNANDLDVRKARKAQLKRDEAIG